MLTSFWAGLSGTLAERWLAAVVSPAFLFWGGGLTAWAWDHGGTEGWQTVEEWVANRSDGIQAALAVGALLLVLISGVVVDRLTLPVLRLLEGYWPRPLKALRELLVKRQRRKLVRDDARFQALAPKIVDRSASPEERDDYAAADRRLRRFPSEPDRANPTRLMPTRLGNVLRAAESRPVDKFGLDPVKCWPRLWFLLPETARKELADARGSVDAACGVWLWGVLFLVWTIWAWWAVPVGLAVSSGAYVWILGRAETFGELVESAFDLYRWDLYEALRWPLPPDPVSEKETGREVTAYLWWGSDETSPRFTKAAE